MKKSVLITGTSSGLGLETAVLFAQKGFEVFATMRNLAKKEALENKAHEAGVSIHILELDVTKTDTIKTCVRQVLTQFGRLDILINNAGGGFAKTTEHASEEEIEWVTDLNYMGVVRCIKAVLPTMRLQKSGHIINITSVGGLVGQPFNEFYCAAKFAVEGYTEALASYVSAPFGIQFSLVEPGGISTEFMKSALANTVVNGEMTIPPYLPILQKYMGGVQERAASGDDAGTYQTPLEVAEVVLQVVEAENPPLRVRTSEWAEEFCHLKTATDPDGTLLVNAVKKRFLS